MATSKIALYLPRYSTYGGVERFAYNLANFLTQQNFKVLFICARQEITNNNPYITIIKTGRPPCARIGKMLWYALRAEQIKKELKPDLNVSLGKTLSCDLLRIGGGPLKVFWQLSQRAYPGWAKIFKNLRRLTSPANWFTFYLEKRQLEQAQKIICVSHLVKTWLIQTYPFLREEQLEVIYNLPDLKKFYPDPSKKEQVRKQFQLPLQAKIILSVATNFKLKGISFLIESLSYLPTNYVLVIAGDRNSKRYHKLIHQLHLDRRVFFLGKVLEMEKLYRAADFFVLNSFYDACSNALLEALACGLISISSKFNGSACFLPASNLIHNPADPKEIAQVIQTARPSSLQFSPEIKLGFQPYLEIIKNLL